MSDIFCGVGNVPKKKKRGSMKQCAEAGQVRYYGIKKVDQKLIDEVAKNKKRSKKIENFSEIDTLKIKIAQTSGKIKKLEHMIKGAKKDESKKKKLEKELDDIKDEYAKYKAKIKKLGSKKAQSRQSSKKKSKKNNKKKSKKSSK